MRNLRNTTHAKFKFEDPPTAIAAIAWDASDDSLILAFGPCEGNPTINLKRLPKNAIDTKTSVTIASWDAPSPNPDLLVDRILDLRYFPDAKTIALVLAGGDIVVVREDAQPGEDFIEIVGSVDAGVSAAAWSPDEELLAVATSASTLLFMTREFESIANIILSPEDIGVSNHVSVGWGKKETQFKGRGVAKTLRDPTVPEHVDEGTLYPEDNGRVSISWRGDGQYVAVNSILEAEPWRRVIRVYSREGVLESVSEPLNGLMGALSWKPNGQVIAGVQRLADKTDIVFFEKNGLRHGEFSLRLNEHEMSTQGNDIDLRWNVDSTVLAVSMKTRVQLWTMGNYHYYLKQEIVFEGLPDAAARAIWHPEKALQLCCSSDIHLRALSYNFEVSRGPVVPPHDVGLVAVIDGRTLKITPLRFANIPPPIAFDEVDLPGTVADVAINETGTEIAVLHSNSQVSVWSCDYSIRPAKRAVLKSVIQSPERTDKEKTSIMSTGPQALYTETNHDRIHYSLLNNMLAETILRDNCIRLNNSEPTNVTWCASSGHEMNFFLAENGVLHIKRPLKSLRIAGCTSFVGTPTHLIYTTSQHLLKFVHLHIGELEIPADEPEKDERCRVIERGAKIVTVIPSAFSLILQMPRGNLETIYPRALVLAGIRQSIKDRDYGKAFSICRTQRVDMNILHDYAPEQFIQDAEIFVRQVKKSDYIDLFLSSLSEDNVSATIYRETLAPQERPVTDLGPKNNVQSHFSLTSSKVNNICDTFLKILQGQSSTRLQNVVTAHVCKNPPDLEAGLQLISELRKREEQERLEQAVEHICFLADVNQLFDTALGLYDLDVALLVAQQSQKDPREYLPYLQGLHEMQDLKRKFNIDNDLRRYGKALSHLHASEAFDELKAYMVKHELYSSAIELYRYDNVRLKDLMRLYADHLSTVNKYKEAGIAYENIHEYSLAYGAYRTVNLWRECLGSAALVPLQVNELTELALGLANSLEEAKDFAAAASIHQDYLNDLESAAKLWCKGFHFAEALQQVSRQGRQDLLRHVIDPGLIEASAAMTELLADMKTQLAAQVPRLSELRQKKAEDPMAFLDGADGGDDNIPDDLSLAPTDASTSGGTFMTKYTNRSTGTLGTNATRKTSKNRRREERKRARGKKGTVYEEEYLINSIARLIERLNTVGEDVAKLIENLMRRAMRERAVAVQAAIDDVHETCRSCIDTVFAQPSDTDGHDSKHTVNEEILPRPWGGEGVLWDALATPKREAPILKRFEKLALLG